MGGGVSGWSPRRWGLWSHSRLVIAFVLTIEALAVCAVATTVASVPVTRAHWIWFALLLFSGMAYLEVATGLERARRFPVEGRPYVHLLSVWLFAGVLLLPPPLLSALVALGYLHTWGRVHRPAKAVVHRKVFSAATVMLGCLAAWGVVHLFYPNEHDAVPFAGALSGPLGLLAVVAAGVMYRVINHCLVVTVIVLTNPGRTWLQACGPLTDQLMLAGAVGLGSGLALTLTVKPWMAPLLVVTVFSLHVGLLMPQFREASRSDAKTGLFDAVFWGQLVSDLLDRTSRMHGTLGVLLLDLDHFKRINDRYGHLAGDQVLRAIADAIKHTVRGHDMVGRYGGEEFAVVLPGVGTEDIRPAAERVRAAVAALKVPVRDLHGEERVITGLTASVGAAVYPMHGTDRTALLLAADAALYQAKTAGRDRTRVAGDRPTGDHSPEWTQIRLPADKEG